MFKQEGTTNPHVGSSSNSVAQSARVSAVIITKNEEHRLRPLLESLAWVGEIVAVDDESTDRTREILEAFGATVVVRPSGGDFDQQRNAGIDAAHGEWILQLDADEIVSPALREEIQRVLTHPSGPVAYRIQRRNYFLGHEMRYGGWGWRGVKLFQRTAARYVGHSVHETLTVNGPTADLTQRMLHYPFQSLTQCVERQNFYTTVQARLLRADQPKLSNQRVRYHLLQRPLKLFWKSYVKKGGRREGMHGLVFAALFAWFEFLKWAKWWEQEAGAETKTKNVPREEATISVETSGSDTPWWHTLDALVSRYNIYTSRQAEQLFSEGDPLSTKRIRRLLWKEPWKVFWKSYVQEGRRTRGLPGLVTAGFCAGLELLRWAKYWELTCPEVVASRASPQPAEVALAR